MASPIIFFRPHLRAAENTVSKMLHQKADRRCPCNLTYCQKQPASGYSFRILPNIRRIISSSPLCVLPRYNHRPFSIKVKFMTKLLFLLLPSNFHNRFHHYFVFPVIVTRSESAPIEMICSASMPDCIQNFLIWRSMREVKRRIQGIPFHRTVTDTAVHHHNRNILSPCQPKKIWPQFRFNQNNCFRIHYIHNSFCDNRQIKRKKYNGRPPRA